MDNPPTLPDIITAYEKATATKAEKAFERVVEEAANETLKIYMEDFSRQLSKAFSTQETKAAEEPAEQPPDLKVLLNILFKAAEESGLG